MNNIIFVTNITSEHNTIVLHRFGCWSSTYDFLHNWYRTLYNLQSIYHIELQSRKLCLK